MGKGRGAVAAGVSTDRVNIRDNPAAVPLCKCMHWEGATLSWQMIILANSGKTNKLLGEGEGTQRPNNAALGAQERGGKGHSIQDVPRVCLVHSPSSGPQNLLSVRWTYSLVLSAYSR